MSNLLKMVLLLVKSIECKVVLVPKKIKFKDIKKVGDIKIAIKMGGLEKFSMKVAEKIQATKSIFSKIRSESGDLSDSIKKSNELFDGFTEKVDQALKRKSQQFNQSIKELIKNVSQTVALDSDESKSVGNEIQGDITAEDVSTFLATLWENHESAQSKFIETGKDEYGEMALDIKVAINNIEEIKTYLIEHGRFDKVEYDYSFE